MSSSGWSEPLLVRRGGGAVAGPPGRGALPARRATVGGPPIDDDHPSRRLVVPLPRNGISTTKNHESATNNNNNNNNNPLAEARRRRRRRTTITNKRPRRTHDDEGGARRGGALGLRDSGGALHRKTTDFLMETKAEKERPAGASLGAGPQKPDAAAVRARSPALPPPHPCSNAPAPAAASSSSREAEQLWHKRTGGGYRLFVAYYVGQSGGVVVALSETGTKDNNKDNNNNEDEGRSTTETTSTENRTGPGPVGDARPPGMSRASQKRRRHRRQGKKREPPPQEETRSATWRRRRGPVGSTSAGAADDDVDDDDDDDHPASPSAYEGEPGNHPTSRRRDAVASTSSSHTGPSSYPQALRHPLVVAFQTIVVTASRPGDDAGDDEGGLGALMSSAVVRHREFFDFMARPLPVSFRVRHAMGPNKERKLREEVNQLVGGTLKGLLQQVRGLGDGARVYQTPAQITKSNLGETAPGLKKFLGVWSLRGGIARQEVGSMLPVLLMQRAGHLPSERTAKDDDDNNNNNNNGKLAKLRVLDLCASPGSKTMQVAELLLLQGRRTPGQRPTTRTGTIRANDVHPQRLQALRDAVARSGIPNIDSVLKYSQLDASNFPIPSDDRKLYDVVMCDVPCSGDGTCRKDKHLLPNWTPHIGNALHRTQLAILMRALSLLQPGGVVAYSTCSLNPVENEAVVAAALLSSRDRDVQLLPLPDLGDFVLRPGVSKWRVADCCAASEEEESHESDEEEEGLALRWHERYQDAVTAGMEGAVPTLWPPDPGQVKVSLHLDRCGRLWPQDQDTGGFFVALLHRAS